MSTFITRRTFCRAALGTVLSTGPLAASEAGPSLRGRVDKAVKISMIKGEMPLIDKFRMAREVGFDGVSLFAPDRFDLKEALQAQERTGLRIHNVNNAVHWTTRLSDPDPEVRSRALKAMKEAIRFAHAAGASSILQVVGKVTDPRRENHEQVWERSVTQIRKALPLAARLGVHILCENVRNGFCTEAERWAEYLDEIGNPWVGAFFDIGNHQSHGGAPHWARTLGSRIVKLDVKGHDSRTGENCEIFQGDVDWKAVRHELVRLRFTGWATAEVSGGGRQRLRQVAQRMDQALGLA